MRGSRHSRRAGYVLVMCLALVAVASMALAGFARRSLQLASAAAAAQENLQRRWGELSCQRLLLDHADEILESESVRLQAMQLGWPRPASISGEIALGGLLFVFQLSDENAKVNLNTLARRAPDAVRRVVMSSLGVGGAQGLTLRDMLPVDPPEKDGRALFQAWSQVYESNSLASQPQSAQAICQATRGITCWGSGQLNLRRASDTAVRQLCERDISAGTIQKLLAARREPNVVGLAELLKQLSLSGRERAALRGLLTDQSKCFSLWLVVRSEHRVRTSFLIDHPGQNLDTSADRITFSW